MKVEQIKTQWLRIREGLISTMEKFSQDDLDFIPVAGGFTVREILLHIAQEEYGEIQYGLTRKLASFPDPYPAQDFPALPEINELLASVHAETLAYLDTVSGGEFNREFTAQWGETNPLADFVFHVLEHEIHHRGELSLILGILGKQGLDA